MNLVTKTAGELPTLTLYGAGGFTLIVTPGRRPTASATLALGRLLITVEGRMFTMISVARISLMASASPYARSAVANT